MNLFLSEVLAKVNNISFHQISDVRSVESCVHKIQRHGLNVKLFFAWYSNLNLRLIPS